MGSCARDDRVGRAMKAIILVATAAVIFVGLVAAKHYLGGGALVAQTIPIHSM